MGNTAPIKITILGENKSGKALDDAEQSGVRFGGAMQRVGDISVKALGAVGLALGATQIALDSLTAAIDSEALNGKLSAQLGLSEETAEKSGKAAGSLYAHNFGDSMEQVNDAVRAVGTYLGDLSEMGQEDIEALSGTALNLAAIFGEDVGPLAASAGQLITTGLARTAEEAFDIITVGFQKGVNKSEDFLDTLNEYAQPFKSLGIDAAMATGILNQGLIAGARNSDLVADALKEFSIRSKDASTTSAHGYQLIGLNAAQMTAQMAKGGVEASKGLDVVLDRLRAMTDPVKRNEAAVALFGTQAEDLQDALFAIDPTTAVESLGEVAGAADKAGDALADNAKAKIEQFKRTALVGITNFIGATLLPSLEKGVGGVNDFVESFAKGGAAGGGVSIGKLFGFEEDSKETEAIIGGLEKVQDVFGEALDFAQSKFQQVRGFVDDVMPDIQEAFSHYLNIIMFIWHAVGDDIFNFVSRVFNTIMGVIGAVMDIVMGIIKTALAIINGDWGKAWDGIKQILGGVWDAIFAIVSGALGILSSILGAGLSLVGELFKSAGHWIKERIEDAIGFVIGKFVDFHLFVLGLPGRMANAFVGMFDGVKDAFKSALNWVIDKWNGLEFKVKQGPIDFTIGTPNIDRFASGGVTGVNPAYINEVGIEPLFFPQGTRVIPHHEAIDALRGGRRSMTFAPVVHVDARGSNMTDAEWERLVDEKLMPKLMEMLKEYDVDMEAR